MCGFGLMPVCHVLGYHSVLEWDFRTVAVIVESGYILHIIAWLLIDLDQ